MKYDELFILLQNHKFEYNKYVYVAIEDASIRDQLVHNITHKNHINIYYNSYHLLDEASKTHPALFYGYWDELIPLLQHENSYHRSIAHWLFTNLIPIDKEHKFDAIKDDYFKMMKDRKFLTGFMALKDIMIMSKWRLDLQNEITGYLINDDLFDEYTEKQYIKIHMEILNYFHNLIIDGYSSDNIFEYIRIKRCCPFVKLQKIASSIKLPIN